MITNDLFLKKINEILKMVSKIIFNEDESSYIPKGIDIKKDKIYNKIITLVENKKINEAEEVLFDNLDYQDIEYLKIGLSFYRRLNQFDNEQLKEMEFSRREIKIGLEDILEEYDIKFTSKI